MIRAGAILGLALVAAGAASADTLAVLKDNTLQLTDARGGVRTLVISEDGSFQQSRTDGLSATGPWRVGEDGRFCFTPRGEATVCIPLPADKGVGDAWEIKGPTGQVAWTAAIIEGRGDPK